MKYTYVFLCFILSFNGSFALVANAANDDLVPEKVAAWVGSSKVVVPIAEEMRQNGFESFLKSRPELMLGATMPFYVSNIEILKSDHPDYYDKLTDAVKNYRREGYDEYYFSSAEEWAEIGDRVLLAFFSLTSTFSRVAYDEMSKTFTPQMVASMPEEGRKQVQNTLDMLKTLQNVSEFDRQLVDRFEKGIVVFFQQMEE